MNGRNWEDEKVDSAIHEKILVGMPDYVKNYYAWLTANNALPKTSRCYLRIVRRYLTWINPDISNIDIRETAAQAINYQVHASKAEDGSPLRKSTRKTTYYALKSFYDYLEQVAGLVPKNMLQKPPSGYDEIKRVRVTSDQLGEIIKNVDKVGGSSMKRAYNAPWKSRDRAIIALLSVTGMRESELCNLDINDIKHNSITFTQKGDKPRTVIIEAAIPMINEWLEDRKKLIGARKLREQDKDAIFISNRRTRIVPNTVANITKRYSKDVMGFELPPHKIRGAYITTLYESTRDIEFARRAVGHACVGTTARYISENPENKKKAAEIISLKIKL